MPSVISRKELIRKFRALGYTGPYSGGKHQFMTKGKLKIRIPIILASLQPTRSHL